MLYLSFDLDLTVDLDPEVHVILFNANNVTAN